MREPERGMGEKRIESREKQIPRCARDDNREEGELLGRGGAEDRKVGGKGFGAGEGDFEFGDKGDLNRRKASFVVAGLVAKDEGDFLGAERSVGIGGEAKANGELAFVHGELDRRELEFAEDARRVGCGEDAEAGGQSGGQLGRDEVVLRGGVGVDVETGENFADDGDFKYARARDRSQRDVDAGRNDFVGTGERVGLRIRGGWQTKQEE